MAVFFHVDEALQRHILKQTRCHCGANSRSNRSHPQQRSRLMLKKLVCLAAVVAAGSAFAQTSSSGSTATTDIEKDRQDIRQDQRDIRRDKADLRRDRRQMVEDEKKGDKAGAAAERADIKADRADL